MAKPLVFLLILMAPLLLVPLAFACSLILDGLHLLLSKAQGNRLAGERTANQNK